MDENVKILALQFWPINEKVKVERTKDFMKLGDQLVALKNKCDVYYKEYKKSIDNLLSIVQTGEPFFTLDSITYTNISTPPSPWSLKEIIDPINFWSCEKLFSNIAAHASSKTKKGIPDVYAAAWLKYFAIWDEGKEKFLPNEKWIEFYKENYNSDQKNDVEKNDVENDNKFTE